jgi:molybdopterin-guanine dinucleotide biosynthesis protein
MDQQPIFVAVSGFSSNVGKTTLVCDLLERLPGWEAIKLTRGHYRSCGKDPAGCCVSDLIRDEPVVRSGREANYQMGKDTGRFWDAGASNVHWVIVKEGQVEKGIKEALRHVKAEGVVIEGNSFLEFVVPDFAVMCARADGGIVKTSARSTLNKCDALYLSSLLDDGVEARRQFESWRAALPIDLEIQGLPILTREDISQLSATITEKRRLLRSVA